MAFCAQCGNKLGLQDKFCTSCGSKLDSQPADNNGAVEWPDLSDFGHHPISFGEFLKNSQVKRFAKHILRGVEKHLPHTLDELVAGIKVRGEDAEDEFADYSDSFLNSKKRDNVLKTPLVIFPDYFSDGILGQFRLAANVKGITQQQDQNGATWGHTDWLFLLQDRIVIVNDLVDNFTWKIAGNFKSFTYSEIQQVTFSQDHLAESGFLNNIDYFFTTFNFTLKNGSGYSRFLLLGQGEDERNNNTFKGLVLYSFLAWKLRIDKNPDVLFGIDGSSTDNTIRVSPSFGIFREI